MTESGPRPCQTPGTVPRAGALLCLGTASRGSRASPLHHQGGLNEAAIAQLTEKLVYDHVHEALDTTHARLSGWKPPSARAATPP